MEDLWRKKYGSLPANTAVAKRSLQERRSRFDSADFFAEHGSIPETPSHSQSPGRIRQKNHDNPGGNTPTGMTIKKKKKMYGSLTPKRSEASSSRSQNNENRGSREDSKTRTNVAQRILAGQHHLPSQRKRFDSADFFLMKEENQQKTSDSTNKKGGRTEGTDRALEVRTGNLAGDTGPSSCAGAVCEGGRKALLKKMLKLDQRTRFDSAEYFSGGGEAIEGGSVCQPASPPAPELISEKCNRQSGSGLVKACGPNIASTSGQKEMAERRIYGSDAQRRRSRFDSADYFLQASARVEETQVSKAPQSTGPDKDCPPTCVATGLRGGQRPQNSSASIPAGKQSSQSPARSSRMSTEGAQLAPAWIRNQMDRAAAKRFDSADFFGGQAVEAGDGLCYDSSI